MISIGDTVEKNDYRIQHYRGSFSITETTYAGKRGKVVPIVQVCFWNNLGAEAPLANNLAKVETFDEAVQVVLQAKKEYNLKVYLDKEKGVKVRPTGTPEILVGNDEMSLKVKYDGFTLRDLKDQHNLPVVINTSKTSIRAIRKLYKSLQDSQTQKKVSEMTFSQVWSFLSDLGAYGHYYCQLD